MKDGFGREIDYMRISVTDRCNLRCVYCMPEEGVPLIPHKDILSYEETLRVAQVAAELGVKTIRLTGGEPLARKGIEFLVADIYAIQGIKNVTLTTNGVLLPEKFEALKVSGLTGVNISLDTVNPGKFRTITRRDGFDKVMKAIDLCVDTGIKTKINCVAMMGVNDEEFADIALLAKDRDICVRFIEYMPVGKHDYEKAVAMEDVRAQLEEAFGPLVPDEKKHGSGPALYFKPEGFKGSIGFISAMSNCFCESCNRIRLTAEGYLKLCLQYNTGTDLRALIRGGASDAELKAAIQASVLRKPRRHQFNDYKDAEDIEENGMSRIGG